MSWFCDHECERLDFKNKPSKYKAALTFQIKMHYIFVGFFFIFIFNV